MLGTVKVLFLCCFDLCVLCLSQNLCLSSHNDEVHLAEEASKKYGSPTPTIFSKIIDKTIPADIIYEDNKVTVMNTFFQTSDRGRI